MHSTQVSTSDMDMKDKDRHYQLTIDTNYKCSVDQRTFIVGINGPLVVIPSIDNSQRHEVPYSTFPVGLQIDRYVADLPVYAEIEWNK